jgi:N-glycosylase/DNA lyase
MNKQIVTLTLPYFNVQQIAESGQIFRMDKIGPSCFKLVAQSEAILLSQSEKDTPITFKGMTLQTWNHKWKKYFDLDTDYCHIVEVLSQKDKVMQQAIEFGQGIRILRQSPWEMLISFIISQNKAIPHIKQCINNISCSFGSPITLQEYPTEIFYSFPTPEQLGHASDEALRMCKVGFRAPYILDACKKILSDEINLADLATQETEKIKETLMQIKGVGPKIADCITLFAYHRGEVFPTDVWIKRVIEGVYFKGKTQPLKEIQKFATTYFGDLAGYAQQYLFFYGRENALYK